MKIGKYIIFERHTVFLSARKNIIYISSSDFNEQSFNFLGKLLSLPSLYLILGDFNFRINDPTDTHAVKFKTLTEQFNLMQHGSAPTHDAGNILGLVLTRGDWSLMCIPTSISGWEDEVGDTGCALSIHPSPCLSIRLWRESSPFCSFTI